MEQLCGGVSALSHLEDKAHHWKGAAGAKCPIPECQIRKCTVSRDSRGTLKPRFGSSAVPLNAYVTAVYCQRRTDRSKNLRLPCMVSVDQVMVFSGTPAVAAHLYGL